MAKNSWVDLAAKAVASGTAVANTTTETILFPDVTLNANELEDGKTLRLTAYGQYSTTGTPTLRFRVRWGTAVSGVLLWDSGTITGGSSVTAALWKAEVLLTVRSNGATGTLMALGDVVLGSATAGTVGSATGAANVTIGSAGGITTPATATCDFTAATALSLSAQWGTNSASNTATGLLRTIERLN